MLAEGAHFACTFSLQRIALRTKAWFAVITAQLAGNAISLIVPGGAAAGAAVQFRMLGTAGMDPTESVGGLTAFSFLGIGGLLALPVFVLPVVLFGAPVASGLTDAAWVGAVGFVALHRVRRGGDGHRRPPGLGRPGGAVGAQPAAVRSGRRSRDCPNGCIEQRNVIRTVLGQQWWQATLLSVGRLLFDYLCLLFCVRAVGAHPRPSLILLAYAVAGVIGLVPITPGGIGIVEASLVRVPGPGRAHRGRGRAGHPGLPAGLLLAADAGRAGRLRGLPLPVPGPRPVDADRWMPAPS